VLRPSAGVTRLSIDHAGQDVTLSWPGSEGWSYLLETTTDLTAWQDLGDPVPGQNATLQWQEPMNGSRRFYRVFDGLQSKTPEP
jgi:hypothetical protein